MTPREHSQRVLRDWSGQTLPLFAIIVPGLLALMALGMDGAQIFLERRDAQSAADLAALSGVRELPDSATNAKAVAKVVGAANGYQQSQIIPVSPYNGDSSKIEVTVNSSVSTFFMPILTFFGGGDHTTVAVSARAVAEQEQASPSGGGYAIFALEDSCSGGEVYKTIDWSGSNSNVTGLVHSQSGILMGGSSNTIDGPTTYECHGLFQNGGGGNSFNPSPAVADNAPPVTYTYADYNTSSVCDFYGPTDDKWDLDSDGSVWQNSSTLKTGVYCTRASGDKAEIVLPRSDVSGEVTFVAGYAIDISGQNLDLTAHLDDILFFSNGNDDKAITWQGSDGDYTGLIYAPRGTAETSGSSGSTLTGGIVADRVKWGGSDITLIGTIGAGAGSAQKIGLIE